MIYRIDKPLGQNIIVDNETLDDDIRFEQYKKKIIKGTPFKFQIPYMNKKFQIAPPFIIKLLNNIIIVNKNYRVMKGIYK